MFGRCFENWKADVPARVLFAVVSFVTLFHPNDKLIWGTAAVTLVALIWAIRRHNVIAPPKGAPAPETGEGTPARPEDLRAICQAAALRARLLGDAKAIDVKLTLPAEPALATVPVDALADVLDNLIGNAMKFSPREATVELALVAREGAWRIEVRDEGPGVPEAERAGLFKKFHRGSATPTGGESSTCETKENT